MALMNAEAYRKSLKRLRPRVYALGEAIEDIVEHPLTRPHVNAAALTYELASPDPRNPLVATSHLSGSCVSRFLHIHQSRDDLVEKVKMLRMLGSQTGSCFQRCVGLDALNALYEVTWRIDHKYGTQYHENLKRHLRYLQDNDLMSDGAMTDPKGDRSLPPSRQDDPDLFLRVVERSSDGIVVSGAKMHQTGAVNSHEIIALPTQAMTAEDRDWAVAFALPVDAPGISFVFGRQTNDSRRLEGGEIDQGNPLYGQVGGEALVLFDRVFVPKERVFLDGQWEFTGPLVELFAASHRQNYGGCKTGVADVLIGACALMAEINGVAKASHIRDKLVEMVHLAETLYCCSLACSYEGSRLQSGAFNVEVMLANVTKLNVTRFVYEIARLAHDIAGGLIATAPSEKDLKSESIGPVLRKYLRARADVPAEDRIRLTRLIEGMTGGTALVESMHGAGSPQAQRVMILRQCNLAAKIRLARKLAGIGAQR